MSVCDFREFPHSGSWFGSATLESVRSNRARPLLVVALAALAALAVLCFGWDTFRWWIAPPSCAEVQGDLWIALEVALEQDWSEASTDHAAVISARVAGSHVDRSSRSAMGAWGRSVADLTPTSNAPPQIQQRIEHLAERGADVVRACE
jgi:hypothetical protein